MPEVNYGIAGEENYQLHETCRKIYRRLRDGKYVGKRTGSIGIGLPQSQFSTGITN